MSKYGRQVEAPPFSSEGMKSDVKVGIKREAPTSRKEPLSRKKILRKEPPLETKKSQPEKEQLQEIASDPDHHLRSLISSSRESTCSTFHDVPCYLEKLEVLSLIY